MASMCNFAIKICGVKSHPTQANKPKVPKETNERKLSEISTTALIKMALPENKVRKKYKSNAGGGVRIIAWRQ